MTPEARVMARENDDLRCRQSVCESLMDANIHDVARAGHNDPRDGERIGAALSGARLRHTSD